MKFSERMRLMIILKVTKKKGFTLSWRDVFLKKPLNWPPSLFRSLVVTVQTTKNFVQLVSLNLLHNGKTDIILRSLFFAGFKDSDSKNKKLIWGNFQNDLSHENY